MVKILTIVYKTIKTSCSPKSIVATKSTLDKILSFFDIDPSMVLEVKYKMAKIGDKSQMNMIGIQ
jgi:hypothetical protein